MVSDNRLQKNCFPGSTFVSGNIRFISVSMNKTLLSSSVCVTLDWLVFTMPLTATKLLTWKSITLRRTWFTGASLQFFNSAWEAIANVVQTWFAFPWWLTLFSDVDNRLMRHYTPLCSVVLPICWPRVSGVGGWL